MAHAAAFVDILARRPTFHVTRNAITTAKKVTIDVKITKILCQLVLKVKNQGFLRKSVGITAWVELRRGQRTSFLAIVKSVIRLETLDPKPGQSSQDNCKPGSDPTAQNSYESTIGFKPK